MSTVAEPINFDALLIAIEFKEGSTVAELAADYGITTSAVESIIRLAVVTQREDEGA